jgi:hypothetical protein
LLATQGGATGRVCLLDNLITWRAIVRLASASELLKVILKF